MQSAHARVRDQSCRLFRLGRDRPNRRRVLLKTVVRAIRVVVRDVFRCESEQVSRVEDDDVIQQVSATTSDPTFRYSVGPSRQQHRMRTLKMESSKSHILFIAFINIPGKSNPEKCKELNSVNDPDCP
jgi:hypothetical protein